MDYILIEGKKVTPAILIAGTNSSVGKTTIATGIMGALRKRGLVVQPFKVGPDYIDPSYHALVCGRPSRNLDSWMVPASTMQELYVRATADADIAVVEGVMGLFDGRLATSGEGSSAEIAKLLNLPVLLVIDAAGTSRSAAAMALGYSRFDPEVELAGVIANNVGSANHGNLVREAIEGELGLPVVGFFPKRPDLRLPERYLGLIPVAEGRVGGDFFAQVVEQTEQSLDLERVIELAKKARAVLPEPSGIFPERFEGPATNIGVARDEAFCFYYQDNLDLLSAWGARLIPLSPLRDASLPQNIQGLYLGGGFPELYASQLAGNRSMLRAILEAHQAGMPVYAECGGLIYLCHSLTDPQGASYSMVGLVPARAILRGKRITLGYTTVRARQDTLLLKRDQVARGHEFHWSSLEEPLDDQAAPYLVLEREQPEGYQQGNLLASYVHLHFASQPAIASNFIASCRAWRGDR